MDWPVNHPPKDHDGYFIITFLYALSIWCLTSSAWAYGKLIKHSFLIIVQIRRVQITYTDQYICMNDGKTSISFLILFHVIVKPYANTNVLLKCLKKYIVICQTVVYCMQLFRLIYWWKCSKIRHQSFARVAYPATDSDS